MKNIPLSDDRDRERKFNALPYKNWWQKSSTRWNPIYACTLRMRGGEKKEKSSTASLGGKNKPCKWQWKYRKGTHGIIRKERILFHCDVQKLERWRMKKVRGRELREKRMKIWTLFKVALRNEKKKGEKKSKNLFVNIFHFFFSSPF